MAENQEIEMTMLESRKVTEILKKALEQIQVIKSERQRVCLKENVSFEKLTDSLEWYLHYMEKIQKGIEKSRFALKELEFRTLTAQAEETLDAILKSIEDHEIFLTKNKRKNSKLLQQLKFFWISLLDTLPRNELLCQLLGG